MGKILFLSNSSGGLYDFRHELIQELKKRKQSIVVCNPEEEKKIDLERIGCKVLVTKMDRRGMNPLKDVALILQYKKIIEAEKPDLVITYTIKPNIYGGLVCRWLGKTYATNITGLGTAFENKGLLKGVATILYRLALKQARVVFFENESNKNYFVSLHVTKETNARVLNGAGVNLTYYHYLEYPEDGECFQFIFIGRIMKEKGIDELFFSMKQLVDEGKACSLVVLGKYEEEYEGIVRRYQDDGWLEYLGYQDDVRPYINQVHCFVLPSYHEGMANTNLECAACGRPIITTNIPGCREAVIKGKSGLLCKPRDAEDLYGAMKKMMGLSNSERREMGRLGRKHMEDVFDKKEVVRSTISGLFGTDQ